LWPCGEVVVDVDAVLARGQALDGEAEGHDVAFGVRGVVAVEVAILPALPGLVRPLVEVDVERSGRRLCGQRRNRAAAPCGCRDDHDEEGGRDRQREGEADARDAALAVAAGAVSAGNVSHGRLLGRERSFFAFAEPLRRWSGPLLTT
jgi:hypothetical protein